MSIGRTARGTGSGTSSDGSGAYQLGTVVCGATGSTIVVFLSRDESINPVFDVLLGGTSMTEVKRVGATNVLSCVILENCTAGTHALVIDDNAGSIDKWEYFAVEITGAAAASFDKTAGTTSSGTAPSSGNTATTAQANEYLIGGIFRTNATIDGSWAASFTQGQTTTQTLRSLEEGGRTAAATGAYAAAKTGETSAGWWAIVATFKEGAPAPTSATIGMSVTATLPAPGRATAITLPALDGAATLLAPSRADATELPSMAVVATTDRLLASSIIVFPDAAIAAPASFLTPQQMSQATSIGVATSGAPYIAAWMDSTSPFNVIVGGGEISLTVVAAIYQAPVMLVSPTEPHYIASVHVPGREELYSIGVTPDLRLCAWTGNGGLFFSAPGFVKPDGTFHQYRLESVGSNILSVDGVAVVSFRGASGFAMLGSDRPVRVMAFNGVAGMTRCACAIMRIEIGTENNVFLWKFSEGIGSNVSGGEVYYLNGVETPTPPDLPGVDWTLRLGWYDPRPGYPLPYGAPPTENPSAAYRWLLQTQYRKANVVRPSYRSGLGGTGYRPAAPTGPGGFRDGEGVQHT